MVRVVAIVVVVFASVGTWVVVTGEEEGFIDGDGATDGFADGVNEDPADGLVEDIV